MFANSQRSAMRGLNIIIALCVLRSAAAVSSQETWSFLKMKQQAAGQKDTIPSLEKASPRKSLRSLLQISPATGRFTSITIPLDFCGSSTSLSDQQIRQVVMDDPRSLQAYFQQCSFGALNLDDSSSSNLVLSQNVPIRQNCGGCNIDAIGQEAEDWIQQNMNIDLNQYSVRIYVFPEGAAGCGFAGMARQGCFDPNPGPNTNSRICRAWLTAFSNRALMHEVGHTLGLGHANKNGAEAADCSSPMSNCGGFFCPNGYHGMMLGWYNPVDTVDIGSIPADTWINKRLPPRVATSTNYLKLTGAGLDYYATYSATLGWENEASDFSNQVLVHSMVSQSDWSRSNIAAALSPGQSDSIGDGSGPQFVLRVANGASLAGATLQVCRADTGGQCNPNSASDSGGAQAYLQKSPPKKQTQSRTSPSPPKKKTKTKPPPPPPRSTHYRKRQG